MAFLKYHRRALEINQMIKIGDNFDILSEINTIKRA